MPDQPSGADSKEMTYRIRAVVRLFQFRFKSRKRPLTEFLMNVPVCRKPLITDGFHISFFLGKMLRRVILEEFDPLLARPLALTFFVGESE